MANLVGSKIKFIGGFLILNIFKHSDFRIVLNATKVNKFISEDRKVKLGKRANTLKILKGSPSITIVR